MYMLFSIKMPIIYNAFQGGSKTAESCLSVFSRRKLVVCVYILAYNWFVNGASYYGLTLASGNIGKGNLVGAVEEKIS